MANFTPSQGRYLAFISAYIHRNGYPPAESEIAAALCVAPPSVNLMVKTLEKKGLILRQPGQPRSIRILISDDQIPPFNGRKHAPTPAHPGKKPKPTSTVPFAPTANLYVLLIFLLGGPTSAKFANKEISRAIEIRGDQTLEQLHEAIFNAYDRSEQHPYEFEFGKRRFDPDGLRYGISEPEHREKNERDARTTRLDDLDLKLHRAFGYCFDFDDDWFHQVQVEKIERAIPTVTYPRIIKRVGKSPPQYREDEPN